MIYSSRNDRTIQELSFQSDRWVKRLETLENEMMIPNDSGSDPAINRMSIRVVDTADKARSTRDSILSLYGHRSYYYKILDPREEPFAMALELQADYSRASRIIDDHLEDDLLPVEAASNAVDKGLEVHAHASTKSFNSSEQSQLWIQLYPCRAIAINFYKARSDSPHMLPFEKYEVLQVAAFSGTTWRVRKTTEEEGLAPSHYLRPYYPEFARVRNLIFRPTFALANELLFVSDKMEVDSPTGGCHSWRPWRKKTGETGIAPDDCFECGHISSGLAKPLPPLPENSDLGTWIQ